MTGLQNKGYKFDIAFVIDATGSMSPIIDEVKRYVLRFGEMLTREYENNGLPVDKVRVRVIDFADYATEMDEAVRQTEFFSLPEDGQKFADAVNKIDWEYRGGDIPENALEALYVAMKSDWTAIKPVERGRHIIVLISDAPPLELQEREGCIGYDASEFPKDIEELHRLWDECDGLSLSARNKRLVLFVPDEDDGEGHSWNNVSDWNQTFVHYINPSRGGSDIDINDVINLVVRSSM